VPLQKSSAGTKKKTLHDLAKLKNSHQKFKRKKQNIKREGIKSYP